MRGHRLDKSIDLLGRMTREHPQVIVTLRRGVRSYELQKMRFFVRGHGQTMTMMPVRTFNLLGDGMHSSTTSTVVLHSNGGSIPPFESLNLASQVDGISPIGIYWNGRFVRTYSEDYGSDPAAYAAKFLIVLMKYIGIRFLGVFTAVSNKIRS